MSSVVDHDVAVMSIFELQQEAKYTISRHASYEISSCLEKNRKHIEATHQKFKYGLRGTHIEMHNFLNNTNPTKRLNF